MENQAALKSVFHVDEEAKLPLLLANVQNLLAYYAQRHLEHRIEIVFNSGAVLALKRDAGDPEAGGALGALADQGVRIAACKNALMALKVDPAALYPFVRVVPAGVAELVVRQAEGFAYIKP